MKNLLITLAIALLFTVGTAACSPAAENSSGDKGSVSAVKPAWVYLPYGYDENDTDIRYNILYLMHGQTMTAGDFLDEGKSDLVNILNT
ncbi:MAG: hypothetical protein ACOX8H_02335 [Ruminococcus sp.]